MAGRGGDAGMSPHSRLPFAARKRCGLPAMATRFTCRQEGEEEGGAEEGRGRGSMSSMSNPGRATDTRSTCRQIGGG